MRQITPIFGHPGSSQNTDTAEGETQTADSDRNKIRERALRNELARLAPQNGIDLIGYVSRRTARRDADEAAALEREKAKARRSILWNCSQSLEVRANLRVTEFSMTDVNMREKMYKDVLTKSKEDGPAKFMDLLNEECRFSTHVKLTPQWLEEQVLRWISHPKERQKPIKLPMPPRDPVFYQRLVDERERRESDNRLKAGKGTGESAKSNTSKEDEEKKGTHNEEDGSDTMPSLVEDSDSDDDNDSAVLI